jgi:hypothetical protein
MADKAVSAHDKTQGCNCGKLTLQLVLGAAARYAKGWKGKMMINFTQAFDSAWERMIVILFRPLDFGKWIVIGFNVFLALLAEGGVAINRPILLGRQNVSYNFNSQSVPALLHGARELLASAAALAASPALALYLVMGMVYVAVWLTGNWIGSRGQFMILDNIVRNRAAVSAPWHRYARQGNTWFLVQIGLTVLSLVLVLLSGGVFLGLNWSWIQGERNPNGGDVAMIVLSSVLLGLCWIAYAAVLFLIHSFVIPLYFKQTISLGDAFAAIGRLMMTHPLSIALYLLVSVMVSIGATIISLVTACVACCIICWLAWIPYAGSLLLSLVLCELILPVALFLRCFQLDCLAQFGPEYDVWIVDVNPGEAMSTPALSRPPPLG